MGMVILQTDMVWDYLWFGFLDLKKEEGLVKH